MQHADLANGIAVVDAAGVEDHFKQKAPFFCACFPMHDSTCVPEDAKRLLYALCRTEQCIESGVVTQGFLHGRMGTEENDGYLICSASVHKGGKPLIAEEIEGDGTRYSLRPMRVTMRVYRAAGGEHIAYYMWVTVESPLPFSLRHAVFETLHKQRNEEWAPEVKRIWNMIITHVRHPHCYMTAANEEQKTSAWNQNLDWIQESNDESFTAMFSAKRALEWLVLDFSHRHEGVALEGVRGFSDHTEMMNGDFIKSCVHYDVDVDNWLKKGLKKRKRPAAASQQQQSTQDSAQPEPEQEEEQLLPPVPPSGCAFAETKRGLPPCAYAMELYATISTNARGYSAFDSMIKTLPLSVQNGICADMVGLRLDPTEQPAELAPTLQQSRVIISGGYNPLQQNKTSFACGDKHWHNHNMSSIHKLPPAERYIGLQRMLQAAVQLSFSRAEGSDGYTNMRAGAYFSYARKHAQGPSRRDCRAMYEHGVFNCGTTAALQRMGSTFLRCNRLGFYLRPDNLHLLQLLCVSDIMQCLNFHNQAIRCAPNGIGATIVIRNGGGHYRRADGRRKELEVCNKTNGSGADITIGVLISMVGDLSIYDPQSPSLQMWDELRKSSEHGLLQRICVRIEGVGSDKVVASTAIDMSMRLYATELRVQNDASSNATITALSQLIPRNTLADTENSILTTEVPPFAAVTVWQKMTQVAVQEGPKNKQRVAVQWKQVIFGILLLSTNMTTEGSVHERYTTICKVARNVASGAQGLDEKPPEEQRPGAGRLNFTSANPDTRSQAVLESARPVFFTAYGVAVCTGFLQWTGMLGELQDCDLFASAYRVFRAQLELSLALLDPGMADPSSLGRSLQVSEARNVAHTLLVAAIEETSEAGRQGEGQLHAMQALGMRLMTSARHPAMLPALMSCTFEHMVRLDFMLLMQMLSFFFQPPADLQLDDVLQWLRDGQHADIQDWLQRSRMLKEAPLDATEGLPPLQCGMYLTHHVLECSFDPQKNMIEQVSIALGSRLFAEHSVPLSSYCQIHRGGDGESTVQLMVQRCANNLMEWPTTFGGSHDELKRFWEVPPVNATHREAMALAPIRVVQHQSKRAALVVDARWLLLMYSMCGSVPCQSFRFILAGRWVQNFVRRCVPDRLWCAPRLYTGLPRPQSRSEKLLDPQHQPSGRTLLLRPWCENPLVWKSQTCPTGIPEDMCSAWPRYHMARLLQVDEGVLPAECVAYSFAPGTEVPVALIEEPLPSEEQLHTVPFGLLELNANDSQFWLTHDDCHQNITASSSHQVLLSKT